MQTHTRVLCNRVNQGEKTVSLPEEKQLQQRIPYVVLEEVIDTR